LKSKLFITSLIILCISFVSSFSAHLIVIQKINNYTDNLLAFSVSFAVSIFNVIIYYFFNKNNKQVKTNGLDNDLINVPNKNDNNDFLEQHNFFNNINNLFDVCNMTIGTFEITGQRVIISENIVKLLGLNFNINELGFANVNIDDIKNLKNSFFGGIIPDEPDIYYFNLNGNSKWFNISVKNDGCNKYVVLVDITHYMIKEYNADKYKNNFLKRIHTRETFIEKVEQLLKSKKNDFGCFITIEFDYLKTINNDYGLTVVDDYIKKSLKSLLESSKYSIIGKKSSFEFFIYIHGFSSKPKVKKSIQSWINNINKCKFKAPDNKEYNIKLTGGYCFYPNDSDNVQKLIRYSGYALYEAKKFYKNTIHAFSMEVYNEDYFMEKKIEAFNDLIYQNEITYKFQPIVNLKNGSIFGYEALMRSENPIFKTPNEIISIAKSENNLYILEKMTISNSLEIVRQYKAFFKEKKFFYNNIASQTLNEEDSLKFKSTFEDINHLLVCEITYDKDCDDATFIKKCSILRENGYKIAIDNFGTEICNNEEFFEISPNYVKIDRSLISDIDIKKEKQSLVARYVKKAKKHNIIVIAVGVETRDEMKTLIRLGVDFAQGYYFSLPKPKFIQEIDYDIVNEIIRFNSNS